MYPFVDPKPEDCRLLFKRIPGFRTDNDGLYMNVWLPKINNERAYPVAIFIHGGAFIVGSTKDVAHNQIQWLLEIEYRLAPHAVHSEQREDLLAAYQYVASSELQNALYEHGHAVRIDARRIIVTGGSAGGTSTVAMALEVCKLQDKLPIPRAIIPAFPLVSWTDEPSFCQPRSALQAAWGGRDDWPIIQQFLDGKGETGCSYPENVFQPDLTHPRTLFNTAVFATKTANSFVLGQDPPYSDADMLAVVPPNFPPTAIWTAMNDTLIPAKHSFILADRLREAGVEVRLEQWRPSMALPICQQMLEWALIKLQE